MKFLVDNPLSPFVAAGLNELGFDTHHVRDRGMQEAEDSAIMELARREGRIVITADTDFGTLSFLWNSAKPSVILFKTRSKRRPSQQLETLRSNLTAMEKDLSNGSIVVIEDRRIRIRRLPIGSVGEEGHFTAHEPPVAREQAEPYGLGVPGQGTDFMRSHKRPGPPAIYKTGKAKKKKGKTKKTGKKTRG